MIDANIGLLTGAGDGIGCASAAATAEQARTAPERRSAADTDRSLSVVSRPT
jgi:hypothetical protein